MERSRVVDLLKQLNINKTNQRVEILRCINEMDNPFSARILHESLLISDINRTTVYRTLACFKEKGLVQFVFQSGRTEYFSSACKETSIHAHFQCEICGKRFCMKPFSSADLSSIQKMAEPGFEIQGFKLLFTGLCPGCKREEDRRERDFIK